MDFLENYIMKQYNNDPKWFMDEVNNGCHAARIAGVVANRNYLAGNHKVLTREDAQYKGKKFVTRKTILQYAKTVIKFHDVFLLGKPLSFSGDETTVKTLNDIYRYGQYSAVDYEILDRVNKFGDAYEAVYVENNVIKSKVLDSGCSYPVYDDMGNYISFIESWTDAYSNVTYWNVYYPTYIERWSNDGGLMTLVHTDLNVVGLPIHYHNYNDMDYNFGVSLLADIKPIMDDLEDIMSKMGDSIYVNTLNPMPVAIGQRIDSNIPADATGYVLNLDSGDFKYANCTMDYNTIKLYLDNLKQMLNDVAGIPSVLGSSTNIANISEVSMQILLMMASINAAETKQWFNRGLRARFEKFKEILCYQGVRTPFNTDIEVVYNESMPVASTEMISNLKALQEMGAVSCQTIMEKSDLVTDPEVEKARLKSEKNTADCEIINKADKDVEKKTEEKK